MEAQAAGLWNLWMPAEMAHKLQPLVRAAAHCCIFERLLLRLCRIRIREQLTHKPVVR